MGTARGLRPGLRAESDMKTKGDLILVIKMKDSNDQCLLTDALNDFLRAPDVYELIDDADDSGWYYESGE